MNQVKHYVKEISNELGPTQIEQVRLEVSDLTALESNWEFSW